MDIREAQAKVARYMADLTDRSIPTVDQRLDLERAAFQTAEQDGDLDCAAEHYARLDALLDLRLHLPQQRRP